MLRTIWLTIQNEVRLLARDPVVLAMLLLAPVVIILVAGYSLGNLYGSGSGIVRVPVIDRDRGEVATGVLDALRREPSIRVEPVESIARAREMVATADRVPVAIEIPAGTTREVLEGREAHLIVYADPVKRLEVNAIELRLDRLCREVNAHLQAEAENRLASARADLKRRLERLSADAAAEQRDARRQAERIQAQTLASVRRQIEEARRKLQEQIAAIARAREQQTRAALTRQLSRRRQILAEVQSYLDQLQSTQRAFELWMAKLRQVAGAHAKDIPPPPAFPPPPPGADLAELSAPITLPGEDSRMPALDMPRVSIELPSPSIPDRDRLASELKAATAAVIPALPGQLAVAERPAIEGALPAVTAFDQYVPGFGVTFLMIGMLLGVSLTLFDEREWGTLSRLRVGGASLSGVLLGKLVARSIVGTLQMVVLFAIGWALFGISLGRAPAALLLPSAGIAFASAAFGLAITPLARSHDGVMPLGTVAAMTMSAIGGCWWPVDFEPAWMRAAAGWLPTTWTMRSYNDLMIRNLPPSSALWPLALTVGLGVVFLAAGLFGMLVREKQG